MAERTQATIKNTKVGDKVIIIRGIKNYRVEEYTVTRVTSRTIAGIDNKYGSEWVFYYSALLCGGCCRDFVGNILYKA